MVSDVAQLCGKQKKSEVVTLIRKDVRSLSERKAELLFELEKDKALTIGQYDQVLRFLNYSTGNGRGQQATDPLNKLSGIQLAENYYTVIKQYREAEATDNGNNQVSRAVIGRKRGRKRKVRKGYQLDQANQAISTPDELEELDNLIKIDKYPSPNTIIMETGIDYNGEQSQQRHTLRAQVVELLGNELENGNDKGLSLFEILGHFPGKGVNGLRAALNKAVLHNHLKYNRKAKLYHL